MNSSKMNDFTARAAKVKRAEKELYRLAASLESEALLIAEGSGDYGKLHIVLSHLEEKLNEIEVLSGAVNISPVQLNGKIAEVGE